MAGAFSLAFCSGQMEQICRYIYRVTIDKKKKFIVSYYAPLFIPSGCKLQRFTFLHTARMQLGHFQLGNTIT